MSMVRDVGKCFFVFKQKTAYEMRISDWSSDVCSSDLQSTAPEDYFNQSTGFVTTYDISRPYNAGSADVKGFAIAYQQSLPMGFGVLANYTYSDGNGKDGADLPYNSRHQASQIGRAHV